MFVDPSRHLEVFSPARFGSRRIDVVGVGATGSRIALSLAKLGIENIHIWDDDIVADVNLANQVYGFNDIGFSKVMSLATIIANNTGIAITTHPERVDGNQKLGEIVFLLVDSMAARKEIFDNGIKMNLRTKLLVESRMGSDGGRVYALNPNNIEHIKAWEATWYPDEEAETSACGASVSVGPTAEIISGLAVWQLIRYASIEDAPDGLVVDDQLENELLFGLRPSTMIFSRKF